MKKLFGIRVSAVVIALLLLVNLGWMLLNVVRNAERVTSANLFRVKLLKTNDVSGVGIYEVATGQPIWTRFERKTGGLSETFFHKGEAVFDLVSSTNGQIKYSVSFLKHDRVASLWADRSGHGSFTDRVTYDAAGVPTRHEVWLGDAWCPVERRDGVPGVIVAGEWRRIRLNTNGTWTTGLGQDQ